ncbi:MAG: hypothetical protein ACT4O1_04375 [Gemmatimonadota bacterium]
MNLNALLRAAQILQSQPTYTMTLTRLHACLAEEIGSEAGSYAQMYLELKKRPRSFMVIDAPRLIDSEEYEQLLEGAGLGPCTRVGLAEVGAEPDRSGALGLAGSTLTELWQKTEGDPELRAYLSHAASELERISSQLSADAGAARPTTHAPGPRR